MKSAIIFRHIACEDSAYPGGYLTPRNIPLQTICLDQGGEVPSDPSVYAGFVFMGGQLISKALGGEIKANHVPALSAIAWLYSAM